MDIEEINTIAHQQMASRQDHRFREPGWIFYHGKRTAMIALHLARSLNVGLDRDALYVAGLFHDIGKGQDRHNEIGAERTGDLLSGLISQETLDVICETVRCHNQRTKSDSFSDHVKLVQDADLIDHVGWIDVWMAFYWSGSQSEGIHDHIAYFEGDECREWREYMRTHLNYDISRRMLEERIQLADDLLSRFHRTYFNGV